MTPPQILVITISLKGVIYMSIGGYYFDPQINLDSSILQAMAAICSIALGRKVEVDELQYLYEHDYTCRLEMEYVLFA
jgi:hypothetical protein